MSFLTAEWRRLILANYTLDPALLQNYLPAHTELDLWQGQCYVSLVGFMFKNVRLLGIAVPFHTQFEEVNLRFYVRHYDGRQWRRGVVFVSEIVPLPAVSWVANTIYKENYRTMPMQHSWQLADHNTTMHTAYSWQYKGKWYRLAVDTDVQATPIVAGSEAEFITEHYWGYARRNAQQTNQYEVQHEHWQQYAVQQFQTNADFGELYGTHFAVLNHQQPHSVLLAEGSAVQVLGKTII